VEEIPYLGGKPLITKGKILSALAVAALAVGLVAAPAQASVQKPILPKPPTVSINKAPPPVLPNGQKTALPTAAQAKIPNTLQKGVVAPKGHPVQKPLKGFVTAGVASYRYAGGRQVFSAAPFPTAVYGNVAIKKPYSEQPGNYHTLAEIAVQDQITSTNQVVEVGFNVDPTVNGGSLEPHIFVFHWVNGVPTCYNGCNWVDYGPNTVDAGDNIGVGGLNWTGTAKQMGIQYFNGDWWVSVGGGWIGYFPGTEWSAASPPATFVNAGAAQLFGETVNDIPGNDCSDMGSGTHGTAGAPPAAYFGSVAYLTGPAVSMTTFATHPTMYSAQSASARTFYYGGPGLGGVVGGC
jgi:hypothetical protein